MLVDTLTNGIAEQLELTINDIGTATGTGTGLLTIKHALTRLGTRLSQ